ncbi:MAG: VanZ family protein [Planctomycetes bacterium]|nr:VanZ family protein [Planctomycetota bacterium]
MKRVPFMLLAAALLYEAVVFYLSVRSMGGQSQYFPGQDKVLHFTAYGIMGLLLATVSAAGARGYFYAAGILSGIFIGVITEYLQQWVPRRDVSFYDGLANVLGLLAAIGIYEGIRLWKKGGILYRETPAPVKGDRKSDE